MLQSVSYERFVLILSATAHMVKAGNNLKLFCLNLIHVTCLAHAMSIVAESLNDQFPTANYLISNVEKKNRQSLS